MQEILERRFRWCIRQVLATLAETERALGEPSARREPAGFLRARLGALRLFFAAVDAGFGAFTQGKPLDPSTLSGTLKLVPPPARQRH
jgi:hypothetical protein